MSARATSAPGAGWASSSGLRLIGHHDLGGYGDGMQVIRHGDALYVGHLGTTGMGTSILDVADPARPVLVTQWPAPAHTHTHKVQVADGLLLVNHEKFPYRAQTAGPFPAGLAIYRLGDPLRPERVAFWHSGGRGVHRVVWRGGRYAHASAIPDHFCDRIWVVVDLADPTRPAEAARWWWPGQRDGEERGWPDGERYAAHHALIAGDRAYLGYDDAGMVVLDVTDITRPRQVAHLGWDGGSTHTCLPLPGRGLVVATDEQVTDGPHAPRRAIRVIDVAGASPAVLAMCPHPDGFDDRAAPVRRAQPAREPARFLPQRAGRLRHLLQRRRAGLRPGRPRATRWRWRTGSRGRRPGQPAAQINDLFVDATGLIWVTDRIGGGLYVLQPEPPWPR